jgi:hypothetical protein
LLATLVPPAGMVVEPSAEQEVLEQEVPAVPMVVAVPMEVPLLRGSTVPAAALAE